MTKELSYFYELLHALWCEVTINIRILTKTNASSYIQQFQMGKNAFKL